jgi:hypothetical protein
MDIRTEKGVIYVRLKDFESLYNTALESGEGYFLLDKYPVLVKYAKYVLEYYRDVLKAPLDSVVSINTHTGYKG